MRVRFQPVLYDKEDDHDKNRNENTPVSETVDCDSRRKKSIVITLVSSHISIFVKLAETDLKLTIHFNSNPNIPAKLPGKNCEETFPQ